jgi:hypothetical protein
MFKFLFGKSKAEVEQASPVASNIRAREAQRAVKQNDTMTTLDMLRKQEGDLEKKIENLEKLITQYGQAALTANAAGKKEVAKMNLTRKLTTQKQVETFNGMLLRLTEQRMALEMGSMTNGVLDAMDIAKTSMKSQQESWSAEKVADLTDDLHEVMDNQAEVNDILRAPLTSGPSESDLDEEMARLSAEAMGDAMSQVSPAPARVPAPAPATAIVMPSLPAAPTNSPVAARGGAGASMDAELAALEAC